MNERENVLRVYHKEDPAWVPEYSKATGMVMSSVLMGNRTMDGGTDIWGVPFTPSDSADGASLPTPNQFILKDITKWKDVIKAPDLSDVDWALVAQRDMANVDYENKAIGMSIHVGYFQTLCNFMGFTEGMCAMYEEPEAVYELLEYLAEFYEGVARNVVKYYKADIFSIVDDTATVSNPFFSPALYRQLIKPFHARLAKIGEDAGMILEMHDCGRCEDFIEDWRDFGIKAWDPCQVQNDLVGIQKKYGRDLVMVGCWDYQGVVSMEDADEEFVRAEVRKCLDTYGKNGGYIFWNYVLGFTQNPRLADKMRWIAEEVDSYGHKLYN